MSHSPRSWNNGPVLSQPVSLPAGPDTPAGILSRLRDGGTEGPRLFHERYGRSVNRLVAALLGPDSEHDDLVHDIFCALLTNVGKVRDAGRLDFWVRAVTVNQVRKVLRRRRFRRLFLAAEEAVAEPCVEGDDPSAHERLRRAWAIIRALPTDERIVFTLRFLEERTLDEVADGAGCSLATAKRRLERARRAVHAAAGRDVLLAGWLEGGLR